jgi:hypothetical protein
MGEKGLSCSDGFDYEPIFGKEAQQCVFLTRDRFRNVIAEHSETW